jgi:hypothetical protein
MRTTVDIDARLLKRVRDEAHRRGVSFKSFLGHVLRRGLEEPATSADRFDCPTFDMGEPVAGFNLDKAMAAVGLLEEDEVIHELTTRK